MSNDTELLEAAKLHAEAVRIIAGAIQDMGHPTLTRKDYENNAVAILARLAHANILIERYDANGEAIQPDNCRYVQGVLIPGCMGTAAAQGCGKTDEQVLRYCTCDRTPKAEVSDA